VAYLTFLGCQAWWTARRGKLRPPGQSRARQSPPDPAPGRRPLLARQEFLVAATNPNATVYVTVGSRLGAMGGTAAHDRVISRVTGTCLLGFAVYLAVPLT
jgi:threonine/homoserine/homoserine lactone efflux protein